MFTLLVATNVDHSARQG